MKKKKKRAGQSSLPVINGVVSICVQEPDSRKNPDTIYCGRPAIVYVWANGRWHAMCQRHKRTATRQGRLMRPIGGWDGMRYALPDGSS